MRGKQSRRIRCISSSIVWLLASIQPVAALDLEASINPLDFLQSEYSYGVGMAHGLWDSPALALADAEYRKDSHTELLFNFNQSTQSEISAGGYQYASDGIGAQIRGDLPYRGSGSAMFIPGNGIHLVAGSDSMFSSGREWSDFTIEFWIYPASFRGGESLFSWEGAMWFDQRPVVQSIQVRAENGKLKWVFDDVFIQLTSDEYGDPKLLSSSFELESRSEIVPRSWSHHMLRYSAETGVLEYLINGRSEAVAYATTDQSADGSPLLVHIGAESENRLSIGDNFSGFMDEFRIQREWVDQPELSVLRNEPGFALIGPIDLGADSVRLTGFDAEYRSPGLSDVRFSFLQRQQFTPLLPNDIADDSQWQFVTPGAEQESIDSSGGRYVYVRLEFLPDGTPTHVPLVQQLSLQYEQSPAPPAPYRVRTEPGNQTVLLSWNDVLASDVTGYLLYYGDRPGEYFGTDADLGPSPIDLGKVNQVQLAGLANGKMYYFRIASYSMYNSPNQGLYRERNMSGEVFARPSRVQE